MNQKQLNLSHAAHQRLIFLSLKDWFKNPSRSFISCFKSFLKEDEVEFLKSRKLNVRDYLNTVLQFLNLI